MILPRCVGIERSVEVCLRRLFCFLPLLLWALCSSVQAQNTPVWKILPAHLNIERAYLAAVTGPDNKIYAIAGRDKNRNFLDTTEVYDPAHPDLGWITLPARLNTARCNLAAVTGADGKIYAIGGYSVGFNYLSSVEVYDPADPAAGWTLLPASLKVARTYLAAVNGPDGRIYAIGGQGVSQVNLSSVEVYDPAHPSAGWTLLAHPLSKARPRLTAAVGPDHKIYAIAGAIGTGAGVFGSSEIYDPAHASLGWTTLAAQLNTPRATLASATSLDGKIYAIGGWDSSTSPLSTVEIYDPSKPSAGWITLSAQLNVGRIYPGAVTGPDGKLYAIGGRDGSSDSSNVNSVEVYDPSVALPHTHLLWANADGHVVLWNIDANQEVAPAGGNRFTTSAPFGPFPGWQPASLASAPDGDCRLLWNHPADGTAALWNVDAVTFATGIPDSLFVYGPFPGWNALAASVGPDETEHLLWGTATVQGGYGALWGIPGPSSDHSLQLFGPYAGWSPISLSSSPDVNVTHLLWDNADGSTILWSVDSSGQVTRSPIYGPFGGWTATQLAGSINGTRYLLWVNANGTISLWTVAVSGSHHYYATSIPTYGPFTGWTCVSLCSDPTGAPRLLWTSVDGTAALWHMKPDGTYTLQVYGPYPGWTCLAASAGP